MRPTKKLLLALCTLAVVGCSGGSSSKTVTLGGILSKTGGLSPLGDDQISSINLAITEINKAGGVLGYQLAVNILDDQSTATKAQSDVQTLISQHVPVVFGAISSGITVATAPITSDAGIVQIAMSSTSPLLTTLHADGSAPLFYRTCPSDTGQGKLLAERATGKGFKTVPVIYVPGAYGQGLAEAFQGSFTDAGGTVPEMIQYTPGQTSYTSLLTQIYTFPDGGATQPDGVLLVAYPTDGTTIINDYLTNYATTGTFWFFTDGLQDNSFVSGVGGNKFTFPHEATGPGTPTSAAYATYSAAFNATYGREPNSGNFAGNAYDAVYLTALSMVAGGKTDAPTVAANLRGVSAGSGTQVGPTDFTSAVSTLKSGGSVNYQGVSGNVDFDANGDVVAGYDIWNVSDAGTIVITAKDVTP
jgi:ABC-type branched-subunit amino acid transport system substrate-binding protein